MPDHTLIHIPRTGGTSVARALGIEQSHEPHWRRELVGHTFAVVRNPWEQVRSWYVSARIAEPGTLYNGSPGMSLEEWAVGGFSVGPNAGMRPRPWWRVVHPFHQIERAGYVLDDIYRYEDLAEWWPTLSDKLLPWIHRSEGPRPAYTEKAIDLVAEFAALTIGMFDYEPPEDD